MATTVPPWVISIHSLRMEGDLAVLAVIAIDGDAFQSTPSAWRETSIHYTTPYYNACISIHSLRMEGDTDDGLQIETEQHFNPLPPHGGRHQGYFKDEIIKIFQSTPSAWRETVFIMTRLF